MTNREAYGERSYEERALTRYESGDVVRIGPSYRMGGKYELDGSEGVYTVIGLLAPGPDYYLARGYWSRESMPHWDVVCHPARLTKVEET